MIEVLAFDWPKDKIPEETTVAFNGQKHLR